MKRKKFAATAVALAMAAVTVFSFGNASSVKAADVTDKQDIAIAVEGDYEINKLTSSDMTAIANQMGYNYFGGKLIVCGSNTTAYVDWDNSSIPYWKAYDSYVIVPVLSRDDNGNLVIEKNEDGSIKEKIKGGLGWSGSKGGQAITYNGNGKHFNILPKEYWETSRVEKDTVINENMGSRAIGYKGVMADDAYIVRIYYTTDNLGDLNAATGLYPKDGRGNADTYGESLFKSGDWDEFNKYYTSKDRKKAYVDFWFLPEGVSTVLNFEEETPAPSPSEDSYTVDLGDSQTVSADTFASILAENATKDVIIKSNNNVTFTFAKGTMSSVDGKTEYDFSTSINSAYADTMPSYITKDNFVSQINFNYSGKLPATANIRFYAGTEYAGQTLYYSLMNADNTFAEVQAVIVDADGYMTVKQDHCSSYVVTKTEPKLSSNNDTKTDDGNTSNNGGSSDNGNTSNNSGSSNNGNASASDNNTSSGNTTVSTDKNASSTNTSATSPKTGDMTPIAIYVVMAVAAMGVIVFVKRRKTA
ncbi:MAG: LPXTG cell wall anchor domain-containing protein [Lachnospira sp.]